MDLGIFTTPTRSTKFVQRVSSTPESNKKYTNDDYTTNNYFTESLDLKCHEQLQSKHENVDDYEVCKAMISMQQYNSPTEVRLFTDIKDALLFVVRCPQAIGIYLENDKFVVKIALQPIIGIDTIVNHNWIIVRAFDEREGKCVPILQRLDNAECKTTNKGMLLRKYILNDGIVKLLHYTCIVSDLPNKCDACQHPKHKHKCTKGMIKFSKRNSKRQLKYVRNLKW